MTTTTITVPSDRINQDAYTVALNDGRAFSCTCPAGSRNQRCKHLARAEARPVFVQVWKAVASAAPKGPREARRHTAMKARYHDLVEREGRDIAMAEVIGSMYPDGHPVCHGLLENHKRLSRWRRSNAKRKKSK
jgi:hypothetical protein